MKEGAIGFPRVLSGGSVGISSVSSSSSMISQTRKLWATLTVPQVRWAAAFRRALVWRMTRGSHETLEGGARERPQLSQGRSFW